MSNITLERQLGQFNYTLFNEKPTFKTLRVNQTHGRNIVTEDEVIQSYNLIDADGIIFSNLTRQSIAIITADCLPILLTGPRFSSFIHVGWRGVHNKILEHEKIKDISPVYAFIGPHIRSCCFEVDSSFRDNFPTSNHFLVKEKRLFFDLSEEAAFQLTKAYPEIKIIQSKICTYCHSFRRNKTSQRNWNIISRVMKSKSSMEE